MKLELKRGGLRVLNIYTVAHRTLLGYAYLAQDAAQVGELDGVVVDPTLPGGGLDIYSEATPRHEVGHWLDLFHVRRRLQPRGPGRGHRAGGLSRVQLPGRTGHVRGRRPGRPDRELHRTARRTAACSAQQRPGRADAPDWAAFHA